MAVEAVVWLAGDLVRLEKRAARAVECADCEDDDVAAAAVFRGRMVWVVAVESWMEGVGISEGGSGEGVGAIAGGTNLATVGGRNSDGSASALSSCPELSVGRSVETESAMLSLGVGITSERMSSPSELASSSSSSSLVAI